MPPILLWHVNNELHENSVLSQGHLLIPLFATVRKPFCRVCAYKNVSCFFTDLTGESSDVHLAVRDVPRVPLWYLSLYDGQAAAHAGPHQHAHHKAPAGRHQPQPAEAGRP